VQSPQNVLKTVYRDVGDQFQHRQVFVYSRAIGSDIVAQELGRSKRPSCSHNAPLPSEYSLKFQNQMYISAKQNPQRFVLHTTHDPSRTHRLTTKSAMNANSRIHQRVHTDSQPTRRKEVDREAKGETAPGSSRSVPSTVSLHHPPFKSIVDGRVALFNPKSYLSVRSWYLARSTGSTSQN